MAYRRSAKNSPKAATAANTAGCTIGIVTAGWHSDVTDKLLAGALETLKESGFTSSSVIIRKVPGSFEIPAAASWLIHKHAPGAVICLGCIIRGETPHFDFIAQAVSMGIMKLNLKYNIPVIFGVLTTNTVRQALERSGGKAGNKGTEAASAALEMLKLKESI
ncbi:MAG: 6,7-dimethyl-8-ribityllumazine synthase [Bacteroidia bacterium]|nr:6,7-dimethyl-8-ribityllumazine synthase [Bacteroidia bacterium]